MRGHMLRKLATYDSGSIDDFTISLAVQQNFAHTVSLLHEESGHSRN